MTLCEENCIKVIAAEDAAACLFSIRKRWFYGKAWATQ